MVDDEFDKDIGVKEKAKEKPSYITRAVAAHRRAGLGSESTQHEDRGVEMRFLQADGIFGDDASLSSSDI